MTTKNTDQKQPLTICGHALPEEFPRGFRLSEQKLYEAAAAEHRLNEIREEYQLQEAQADLERQDAALDVLNKAVTALEKRLSDLYAAEDLNLDAIEQAELLLARKKDEATQKTLDAAAAQLAAVRQQEARMEALLQAVDTVNLQTVHAILQANTPGVPAFAEFQEAATADDYEAAREVVETGGAGASPLARYVSRASRHSSRTRSDLN